jgi:hypothetical protein
MQRVQYVFGGRFPPLKIKGGESFNILQNSIWGWIFPIELHVGLDISYRAPGGAGIYHIYSL